MSRLFDTVAGRAVLVLVLGLGSTLFLAQYLYLVSSEREVLLSNADRVAERLLVLAKTITAVSREARDDTAHRLSGGAIELHWSAEPLTTAGGELDPAAQTLRGFLLERAPELASRGLIFGTSAAADDAGHTTLISLRLEDGSWLNVSLARVQATRFMSPSFLVTSVVGALGVVLVAILLSRWLTKPLDRLADGARTLFVAGEGGPQLEETGTREVRTLAAAINEMRRRIERMVADRTQMLAAISHDLRTPLTRLRLRTNALPAGEPRTSIERDIAEMEQMIEATLGFLRENAVEEPVAPVDLAAILQSIADDAADAGQEVAVDAPRSLVVRGRHLALKRLFTNLVGNAIRHGGSAEVRAQQSAAAVEITISDNGPGIPPEKLEAVFEPFCRLDDARGRETGGYGLGLTVARSIARGHGGEVVLVNRPSGGLAAIVRLPKQPQAA
jgi:signal transduction histidine kinase